jgi:hypothetical protein
MVAAGVGSAVGLTLYVISEGRYEAQNFPNATLDEKKLLWDRTKNRSNYQDLVADLMGSNGGRTWVTEYAKKPDLTAQPYPVSYGAPNPGLGAAYYSACNNNWSQAPTFQGADAGEANASDASANGSIDAGARDAGPSKCSGACCDFDDLDLALTDLHPSNVFVTRLRARLAPDALKAGDLRLVAAASQEPVENVHYAPADPLPTRLASGLLPRRIGSTLTIGIALVAALGLVLRRRRATRREG